MEDCPNPCKILRLAWNFIANCQYPFSYVNRVSRICLEKPTILLSVLLGWRSNLSDLWAPDISWPWDTGEGNALFTSSLLPWWVAPDPPLTCLVVELTWFINWHYLELTQSLFCGRCLSIILENKYNYYSHFAGKQTENINTSCPKSHSHFKSQNLNWNALKGLHS